VINNKKKLIYAVIAVLVTISVAVGAVIILGIANTKSGPTLKTANDLKSKAINYLKKNDKANAKKYFLEAKQQYTELKDANNVVDTNAQLYLIEK
jgi:tRNA G26 N,N-dimethylase Trm1